MEFEKFFLEPPDAEEKAWDIIHDFYNYLLTWMEKNNISKADLARILGKSRASITKMFNYTPNVSIKKIVEITHKLGLDVNLEIKPVNARESESKCIAENKLVIIQGQDWIEQKYDDLIHPPEPSPIDFPFEQSLINFNNTIGQGYA